MMLQWSPASSSGETYTQLIAAEYLYIASMEPRFIKRGDARTAHPGVLGERMLQWSPASSSGETSFARGLRGPTDGRLQWSPASSSGETRVGAGERGRSALASMEPRFIKRGDPHARPQARRGSRCFNGAPLHQAGRRRLYQPAARRGLMLQWSPASSSGETSDARPRRQGVEGASMEPRFIKRGDSGTQLRCDCPRELLQWSPASSSGETRWGCG